MIASALAGIGGLAALVATVSQILRLQGKEWPSRGWKSFDLGRLFDPKEQFARPLSLLLAAVMFFMVTVMFGQELSLWTVYPAEQLLWTSIAIAVAHVMHAAVVWHYQKGEPFLDGLWLTVTLTSTGIASTMLGAP